MSVPENPFRPDAPLGRGPDAASLIVRQSKPKNLEMRFSTLDGFITPVERFYVRCHFPVPEAGAEPWRLRVEGDVRNPLDLDLRELQAMPARTVTATLECAGNGRAYLSPRHEGVQWELGAVGTAEWRGVPLAEVLGQAGLDPTVTELILEGADRGQPEKTLRPANPIHFARSITVRKAHENVLLAYEMNGQPLAAAHGSPLRAIVPGWYATASVKWLRRVVATAQPFHGYFQSVEYAVWQSRPDGQKTLVPLTDLALKASIARPAAGEVLPADRGYAVFGAAWGGNAVSRVEVTCDGGKTWNDARLLGERSRYAWRLWEFSWRTPATPGPVTLAARAHDDGGAVQPGERDEDLGSYAVHHCLPITVEVR